MNNYESVNLAYSKTDLQNIFNSMDEVVRPCNFKELLRVCQSLKLKYVKRILYFSIYPDCYGHIHIDKTVGIESSAEFALNIPITDGNHIYMNWFKKTEGSVPEDIFAGPSGTATPRLDKTDAILIDTRKLNSATFVKINDWHNVENRSTDTIEKIISIRFDLSKTIDNIKKII
jgi:hypothetical protein